VGDYISESSSCEGYHILGSDYKEYHLMGCDATYTGKKKKLPIFIENCCFHVCGRRWQQQVPHQNLGNFYQIAWRHIPEVGMQ
jgi:hypothetical protein